MFRHFANPVYRTVGYAALLCGLLVMAACSSSPKQGERQDKVAASNKQAPPKQAAAEPAIELPPPIPPEATRQFEKALALLSAGDTTQAEVEFKRLNASYPDYSGPLANLGVIYLKAGKLKEAEQALHAATERGPQNAAAFNQLGIVYRKLGHFKEADAAYTRALTIDTNYALAYLNLGVLCDLYLQQPERALPSFERYLELTPAGDTKVTAWVKELKARLNAKTKTANGGAARSE